MSIVSGLFGLDASNNAAKQASQQAATNHGIAQKYGNLFGQASGDYGDFLGTLSHFNVGHAIGAAMNQANADPSKLVDQFGQGANETATKDAGASAAFMRSQGYGDGATVGAGQGFFQRAQAGTNAYAAQQYDPSTILAHLNAILGAAGSGENLYGSILSRLSSGAYGAPQVQQAPNPLVSILGSLAGQAGSIYSASKA